MKALRAVLVAGLAWGDEGKGACVDALTRHLGADLIVRYNGGCQAAHHVVTPEGNVHCFSQFGAGMLADTTVRTHLSRFMLVEPTAMMREANALNELTTNVWWRTTVDGKALIVTPFHRNLNRFHERSRGDARHGSCGRGIGVTRHMHIKYGEEVLFAKDTQDPQQLKTKLYLLRERYREELEAHPEYIVGHEAEPDIDEMIYTYTHWPAAIVDQLKPSETMIFEGAQGVLLDEKHGIAPHNTWTNTTFDNAELLLAEVGAVAEIYRIGCLRSYYTRHGAGPFPTEDQNLMLPEPHNKTNDFQGNFRVGEFDFTLARKAIKIIGGVDGLAISHLDYLPLASGWREREFIRSLSSNLRTPIVMEGRGPTAADRKIRIEVLV